MQHKKHFMMTIYDCIHNVLKKIKM